MGVEKTIADIVHDVNVISKRVTTHSAYNNVEESLHMLTYMCSSLHRALSYQCLATVGSKSANITNLCRHAIALHILAPWRGFQPDSSLAINTLMHKTKACLAQELRERVSDDFLLWLLFTGGVAAIGVPERGWFVGYLRKVVDDLGVGQWDDVQTRLGKVIWHQRLNAKTHQMLWNEVLERRKDLDMNPN
jgi:hypothetical protein